MPSKSRRGRAKHSFQNKKRKGLGPSHIAAQPPALARSPESVAPAEVAVPSVSASPPMPKTAASHHPFITTELRRIGILAGIMLVILIVLAVVFA